VRAGQLDVHAADGRHAQKVVGAGQKAPEGRREGDFSGDRQPHRRPYHVLLRNEALEEALRTELPELLRIRRVHDVAVEHDDALVMRPERGERVAEGFARGDLLSARCVRRCRRRPGSGGARRARGLGRQVGLPGRPAARGILLQALDHARREVGLHGLSVLALAILQVEHALALECAGQHHGWPVSRARGLFIGCE
jgi:hypothetical protein